MYQTVWVIITSILIQEVYETPLVQIMVLAVVEMAYAIHVIVVMNSASYALIANVPYVLTTLQGRALQQNVHLVGMQMAQAHVHVTQLLLETTLMKSVSQHVIPIAIHVQSEPLETTQTVL